LLYFSIAEPLPSDGGSRRYVVAYYVFSAFNTAAERAMTKLEEPISSNLAYQNRSWLPVICVWKMMT